LSRKKNSVKKRVPKTKIRVKIVYFEVFIINISIIEMIKQ